MGRFHEPQRPHAERLREFTHLTPEAMAWIEAWLDRLVALGAPRPFIYGLPDEDTGDLACDGVFLEWDAKRYECGIVCEWSASLECGPGPGRYLWLCDMRCPVGYDVDLHDATVTLDDATTERIAAVLIGMGDLP